MSFVIEYRWREPDDGTPHVTRDHADDEKEALARIRAVRRGYSSGGMELREVRLRDPDGTWGPVPEEE